MCLVARSSEVPTRVEAYNLLAGSRHEACRAAAELRQLRPQEVSTVGRSWPTGRMSLSYGKTMEYGVSGAVVLIIGTVVGVFTGTGWGKPEEQERRGAARR